MGRGSAERPWGVCCLEHKGLYEGNTMRRKEGFCPKEARVLYLENPQAPLELTLLTSDMDLPRVTERPGTSWDLVFFEI